MSQIGNQLKALLKLTKWTLVDAVITLLVEKSQDKQDIGKHSSMPRKDGATGKTDSFNTWIIREIHGSISGWFIDVAFDLC